MKILKINLSQNLQLTELKAPDVFIADASLTRPLHHQASACPHSHGNPPPQPQPPPQVDYVIPHPVHPFHPSISSHASSHPVPPPPPTHPLANAAAPIPQHLPATHQPISHHIPATAPPAQRLHPHEVIQRMEVQRRRMMQHPTYVTNVLRTISKHIIHFSQVCKMLHVNLKLLIAWLGTVSVKPW